MTKINLINIIQSNGQNRLKLLKIIDHCLGSLIAKLLRKQASYASFEDPIKRILIIRPGGIGDAVILLPILKELKNRNVRIDLLCESRNSDVFTSQGYIVHTFNNIPSLIRLISTKSYDAVVDTEQWHLFSAIMAYFTKTSFRIGYSSRDLRTKLFNKTIPYEQHAHELENFQRLFNELQSEPLMINNLNNSFRIPDHLMRWAESQIPYNSITIFLGSSIKLRRLSLGEILKLLQSIHLKGAIPVLLGGRDVAGLSKQIVKTMNGSPVLDFIGKTSLIESAAIIQRSRNFIGPDSGIMHLACSVGTPVVAVFGPGNLNKWGPKGSLHRIVTNNASCSPCTNFGYTIPTCQGSYHCLKDIRIEF